MREPIVIAALAGCLAVAGCATGGASTPASPTEVAPSHATAPRATHSPNSEPTPAQTSVPLTSEALRARVGAAQIRPHLEALQRIADANGGNRTTGTPGFDASVAYVAGRLEAAGYDVERRQFAFDGGTRVNLIAERQGTEPGVVMFGAHLDSGTATPGINDNGTGVATLLALAELLAEHQPPDRTVRFAFWDAEEPGLYGSRAYVTALETAGRAEIAAYLNFDMLGSPNHIRFVYDESGAASGSDALTDLFATHFDSVGLAWAPIDLEGHSDHGPFTDAGIPTGGLFSGGIEPKTDAQAALFGGTAGIPADPCSDRACDTIDNVSDAALNEMADAVAHALAVLVTEPVSAAAP